MTFDPGRVPKRDQQRGIPAEAWVRETTDSEWHLVDSASGVAMYATCGAIVPTRKPKLPTGCFGQWRPGHWPPDRCCQACLVEMRATRTRLDNRWKPENRAADLLDEILP